MARLNILVCMVAAWFWPLVFPEAAAAPLLRGDYEQATATGVATKTGPRTIADFRQFSGCGNGVESGNTTTQQVHIVDRPVRQGNYAARYFLSDRLPGGPSEVRRGMERCEKELKGEDAGKYGEATWYAWSILIPTENQFRADDTYARLTSWSTHSQIATYYPDARGYVGDLNMHLRPTPAGDWILESTGKTWAFGDLQKGVWHDFLLKMKFHLRAGEAHTYLKYRKAGGTFAEVVNDTRPNQSPKINPADGRVGYFFKTGIYRNGQQDGNAVIYVDGPWIGGTEADVLPFFGGTPAQPSFPAPSGLEVE